MKTKSSLIIALAALALAMAGCAGGAGGYNMYSTSDDLKLGEGLVKQINADAKNYPKSKNEGLRRYVQSIVDEIVKSPDIKYRGVFKYRVELIENPTTINAFCCPGGYIYVYTGLLDFLTDEATLAAVLAHEIAHAECRHATQRMTSQKGMESLVNLYKEKNKNKTTEALTTTFTGLTSLANSRENEYEADEFAFKYLRSTKWYPGAILRFFDKIKTRVAASGGAFDALLSTHPMPQDRVDRAIELIKKADIDPAKESNLLAKSYNQKISGLSK